MVDTIPEKQPDKRLYSLLWAGIGALFFLPFLGRVHLFDWDEINFAEMSREMMLSRDYLRLYINYLPFWEKPPLFIWMQVLSMKAFGMNEFAARFPNALLGSLALPLLYRMGRQLWHHRFGMLWAGAYLAGVLPHLYFRSGIIDPWFNLFIFIGLYFFIRYVWCREQWTIPGKWSAAIPHLLISGAAIGLAMLTKGPVALLLLGLTAGVYWAYRRFAMFFKPIHLLWWMLAVLAVAFSWYGVEYLVNGGWFLSEFTRYQIRLLTTPDAGHKGFFGFHVVVLLIGCFPASIFAVRALRPSGKEQPAHQEDFRVWMVILLAVVVVVFSLVRSKIVHYSSLAYYPLTFLAAWTLEQILSGKWPLKRAYVAGLWSVGSLYIILTLLLPIAGRNPEWLQPLFAKDPFALANLEANVHWSGWETLCGTWLALVLGVTTWLIQQQRLWDAVRVLGLGTALFVTFTLWAFIGRIEQYSQGAAIEFYKEKSREDCYIHTYQYKSYAHLYYAAKAPVTNPNSNDLDYLLKGPKLKPVYIVARINKLGDLEKRKNLRELYRKNGFVFFERK